MLVYAFARYMERNEAVGWARRVYDNYPLQAADALAKIGGRSELEFLLEKVAVYNGPGRASINRSIRKLEKKLKKKAAKYSFYHVFFLGLSNII